MYSSKVLNAIHDVAFQMFKTSIKDSIIIIGGASLPLKSEAFKDRYTRDLDLDVIGLDNETLKKWVAEEVIPAVNRESNYKVELVKSGITKGGQLKIELRLIDHEVSFPLKIDFGKRGVNVEPLELESGIRVSTLEEDSIRKLIAVTKGTYIHAKHLVDLYYISKELRNVSLRTLESILSEFGTPATLDILNSKTIKDTVREIEKLLNEKSLDVDINLIVTQAHKFVKGFGMYSGDNAIWTGDEWVW